MNFFNRHSRSKRVTRAAAIKAAIKGIALGTIGASLVGMGGMANPALALTTEQVSEKLTGVPVYVISSTEGLVLISTDQEGQTSEPSLFVFMSEQDATTFLTKANENNPEFAPNAQVTLTSLENLYKETQATDSEQPLRLTYFPEETEVTEASAVNAEYRGGVPLFYAQFEDGSLVPVPQGEDAIYPMFFSSADLEAQLANLAQTDPEARAAITIGVLPLEIMLQEMQSEDYETLQRIRLLPDSETINTIRQSSPQPPAQ
jgi:Tic22-like family